MAPVRLGNPGFTSDQTTSTSTAVDMAAAGSIPVGNYLFARLALDNSGTNGAAPAVTVTDPRGNSWTIAGTANADPGAANAGTTCVVAYAKVSNAYTDGDVLVFSHTPTVPARAIIVEEWTGIHPTAPIAVAATSATGVSATPSIAKTPTAAGQVVYVALATEGPNADVFTQDADTTEGFWDWLDRLSSTHATAANNQTIAGGWKEVTGTGAQTYNPAITSRDWAMVALVLAPVPVGGGNTNAPALEATGTSTVGNPTITATGSAAPSAATGTVAADNATITTATPATSPGEILNIGPGAGQNHFAVQVAPNGAGSIATHTQAEISAGYSEDPYFVTTPDDQAVQFWARMDGPTTSGSTAARSELRELDTAGVNHGFDPNTGEHWMRGKTRITHLPPVKPEVVVAQLHNGDSDRIAIRTQLISSQIKLLCRINGTSSGLPRFEEVYTVGTEFEWMITVVDGAISVFYQDMTTPIITAPAGTLAPTAGITSWYFKSGCYNQSNETTDDPLEFCSTELRQLQHWHTGWPDPNDLPGTTTANAATATGTGTVDNPVITASGSATALVATGTSTVNSPVTTASGAATALVATGTGTVDNPATTASGAATALVASGTSTVDSPAITSTGSGFPSTAAGTGTVNSPAITSTGSGLPSTAAVLATADNPAITASGNASALVATGTSTVDTPAITSTGSAAPSAATGTGVADNPAISASGNASAQPATGTGTVDTTGVYTSGNAAPSAATGTVLADNPVANTSGTTNVAASTADATGSAGSPAVTATGNGFPSTATASATVDNPSVTTSSTTSAAASTADATGAANTPAITATGSAAPSTATGTSTVDNPVVNTSGTTNAPASTADVTGSTGNPAVSTTGTAPALVATGTSTVNNPAITATGSGLPSTADGTGSAHSPTAAVATMAVEASVTVEGYIPGGNAAASLTTALVAGNVDNPTVLTGSGGTPSTADATGSAGHPTITATGSATPSTATGTSTVDNPAVTTSVPASVTPSTAGITVAAPAITLIIVVRPTDAPVAGTVGAPVISASGNALALTAIGSLSTFDVSVTVPEAPPERTTFVFVEKRTTRVRAETRETVVRRENRTFKVPLLQPREG